ncbi:MULTISPECIES: DUF6737 family protein [unclassified Cyanobium]|uniref:DUF6737 family protein n=1 Tax=unclassified Cyanobium TaxID=2627006 RepID=UPI0020CFA11D|nr:MULTISPECIES: DUF6737 family protein [unclassified Cyanobium]MCP9833284.1 hypothetical protein [Cyanobium sp. La Preciosa 7G6]MCP9935853.1 hypothetical protein [Cyanobium sp. Aljojuca 7A6]
MPNPDLHEPSATPGSVWELKPWWCQPWSILLTGLAIVGASWLVLQLWWITAGVSLVIGAWWLLFLVLMPAAWKRSQAGGSSG